MLTISTTSYCWRWRQRTRDRDLFLYLKPVIFGPLVSPTTRPVTVAPPSSSGVDRTVSPSTSRIGVRATSSPTAAPRRSTSMRAPSVTRACFPPVFTTAYIGVRCYRTGEAAPKAGSIGRQEVDVEDHAPALAHRAQVGERLEQALADPLAGHLDQAELGDVEHLGAGLVTGQRVAE